MSKAHAQLLCDLHTHSTCSDGTASPAEVVRLAHSAGLAAMALTDHDTLLGTEAAQAEGARLGVRVVPGVELSLEHERGTFHLIGLGVDPACAAFRDVVATVRDGRPARNRRIVERLQELGIDIRLEEVLAEAQGVVGRPHIAAVLVRKGVVRDPQAAFDAYLAKGAKAYADRVRVTLPQAVEGIRRAGGVSILCHPFTLGFGEMSSHGGHAEFLAFLGACRRAGMDAMEVRYGSYSAGQERYYEGVAEQIGLLPSGGSDFHGDMKPHLAVGVGKGSLRVPLAWLDALQARARANALPPA